MSISGLSSYDQLTQVSQLAQLTQLAQLNQIQGVGSDQGQGTASASTSQFADQASLSPMGQMMSRLSQLQTSDPDKFKSVTQAISEDLATQAENCTDSTQAQALSELSEKFQQASETGSMDALKPEQSGKSQGAEGGGQGGQGEASGLMEAVDQAVAQELGALSNADSTTSSLLDQNQTGVNQYAINQPGLNQAGLAAYRNASLNVQAQNLSSTLNSVALSALLGS